MLFPEVSWYNPTKRKVGGQAVSIWLSANREPTIKEKLSVLTTLASQVSQAQEEIGEGDSEDDLREIANQLSEVVKSFERAVAAEEAGYEEINLLKLFGWVSWQNEKDPRQPKAIKWTSRIGLLVILFVSGWLLGLDLVLSLLMGSIGALALILIGTIDETNQLFKKGFSDRDHFLSEVPPQVTAVIEKAKAQKWSGKPLFDRIMIYAPKKEKPDENYLERVVYGKIDCWNFLITTYPG